MHNNSSKPVRAVTSAILALSLTLSAVPVALAAEAGQAGSNSTQNTANSGISPVFSDVKLGHWAEKHIHKLAAQGILKGNNGKFRPGDDITQQEAIALAIRFMNLEGQLSNDESVALPADFKVGNYFKPYIVLAFQKGLLDKNEELKNPDPKKPWGDQKASREWITKILVRAVGKQSAALEVKNKPTSFADNSKISASALGYVNVALDLQLTTGMSNNKFEPLGNVNRAQIATFFSRGEAVANIVYDSVVAGIVGSVTDTELRLYTEDNKWANYRIDNKTMWYKADNDKSISAKDIPMYTKVRVIGQLGSASYVELLSTEQQVESVQTTLKYAVPSEKKLYVKNSGREDLDTVLYEGNTLIKDAGGAVISADKLSPDSELTITRETFSKDRKVLEIQVKSGPVNKNGKGTITSVDVNSRMVTIKLEQGDNETYRIADDATVRYDNVLKDIKDLKVNDVITFSVKNSSISSIVMSTAPATSVEGRVDSFSPNMTSITVVKDNNKLEAKVLAGQVAVVIPGLINPSLGELIAGEYGDRVKLTVNGEDKVTRIEVLSRKVENLYGVSVIGYDAAKKLLTVVDDKNTPYVVTLNDGTKYEFNGSEVPATTITSMLTSNRKVNVKHINKKALVVQYVYKYEGKLIVASPSSRTITLQLANDDFVTLPYQSNSIGIELYGNSSAKITDIKNGDFVTAMLSGDQNSVMSLTVRSYHQFEVASINTSTNRITLRNAANRQVEEFSLSSTPIYGVNNEKLTLSNLNPNDVLNAVFDGRSLVELRKVAVTAGRVESVDTTNGIVVVKDYNGQTTSHPSAGGLTIILDTTSTTAVGALKVGDRVEVRKDAKNGTNLKVLTGLKHDFWKYDASAKQLYVKRSSLSDTEYYWTLSANVVIRNTTGDTLSISSLKSDDKIVLYFLNGQIIEIEKQ
ncbi:S-layer homology domain-containing protein [Paenibacillus sp. ACRRX]|uniref:S-layer homology domain-containing protein n=1 Tax=Paenibacillus sp. ACRRX TaxID=2918206 RepID=UPI001EF42AC7|nr:S-layer homology domain-containing protein [Paenibacillus sp. ACRRX]MCG7406680.1 S-layer homology domain-containing protein [Paenibacillus sp. ACRRX]